MTTLAVVRIVAAEGASVVMTGRAALHVFRRKVHRRNRRGQLSAARRTGFCFMTAITIESVTGVAERRN